MDGTIAIWDVETGRQILTLEAMIQLTDITFSADGRRMAAGCLNGPLIWNALPWRVEDLPGDPSMSYEERVNLSKTPNPDEALRVWRQERSRAAKQIDVCASHLLTIHRALGRYRKEHDDQLPDWLSDLVPDYLTSTTLLCPADPMGVAQSCPDPRLPCSYGYQFSSFFHPSQGMKYREWKTQQLREFGDIVPTVRCYSHAKGLNLSYGGRLYLTQGPDSVWETGPREDYVSSGSLAGARARTGPLAMPDQTTSGGTKLLR